MAHTSAQRNHVNSIFFRRERTWRFFPLPGRSELSDTVELLPLEGFVLAVMPGKDCEPLWLGLCRHPLTMLAAGRRRTGLGGWRWKGFCKIQFASLHAWPHFRRCHLAVLGLLDPARRLGWRVKVSDKGNHWPDRNEAKEPGQHRQCIVVAGKRQERAKGYPREQHAHRTLNTRSLAGEHPGFGTWV